MASRACCMILLAAVAGCAGPDPALYTLEPVRGTAHAAVASLIAVRVADIPRYLEREEIVRSADGGRVVVAQNDWWSEPLKPMLQRVLAEDLAQRLPASDVLPGSNVLATPSDVDVVVTLTQLDRTADGQVTLAGFAAIRPRRQPEHLEPMRIVMQGSGRSITDQVGTTSATLAAAADVIAARLANEALIQAPRGGQEKRS